MRREKKRKKTKATEKKKKTKDKERGARSLISGAGQPLEAGRGFCTGVLRRLLPKAVWCHGERGKTRKEEKKPKERGVVRRNTKEPEGARYPPPTLPSPPPLPPIPSLHHLLLVFLVKSSPDC